MSGEFSAVVKPSGGHVVVDGDIDGFAAPQLRAALTVAAVVGRELVVDLSSVRYLDGRAIPVLHEFAASTDLEIIVAAGSAVEQVLRICGLAAAADLRPVRRSALRSDR